MKKYILMASVFFAALSCVKDDSTIVYPNDNEGFSHIKIEYPLDTVSVDVGLPVTIAPTVTQTHNETLSYVWSYNEISGDGVYSELVTTDITTPEFSYGFPVAQNYRVRLEVKNSWGSEVKDWVVQVRNQDQGYYILSEDENGNANYSFARSLSSSDVAAGVEITFVTDIIAKVNPDYTIKNVVTVHKNVARMDTYGTSNPEGQILYLLTETDIYFVNPFTFQIFNVLPFDNLVPGEKIEGISTMDENFFNYMYIFTDAKRCYLFSRIENTMNFYIPITDGKVFDGYDRAFGSFSRDAGGGWNPVLTTIYTTGEDTDSPLIWTTTADRYGCGPYSNTGVIDPSSYNATYPEGHKPNVLDGCEIMTVREMNGYVYGGQDYYIYVIARERANPLNIKIFSYETTTSRKPEFKLHREVAYTSVEDISYLKDAPIFANGRFGYLFYSDGADGIYFYYPKNQSAQFQLPTETSIKLGAGKVITTLNTSHDFNQLYVGFYDNNATGEYKGGMYVYDANSLELLEKYEGVADRPIKVGYKKFGRELYYGM